ncbi:MAG: universal stress protein [Alphaproteobacteria bacterium]|nr:MAG: universal stress protein [Alphaproteobacteria bacterium]
MSDDWPFSPPRKILLATDLSARSDRALDRAVQLARQWDSHLIVVHALEKPDKNPSWWAQYDAAPSWRRPPDPANDIEEQIRRDAQQDLGAFEVRVSPGDPADVVVETAEKEQVDLIVLGTARNETLGRMMLGNTIEQLVRKSPVSILVVKNRPRAPYRHILVGTDFTEESRFGLIMAAKLFPEATFALMHAFEMPYRSLMTDSQLSRDFSAMEKDTIKSFVDESSLTEDARQRVIPMIEHGAPPVMLGKYASERGTDLTVIGAFNRSLAFHVFIGGTARRIVDAVPSDVFVVRAPRPD